MQILIPVVIVAIVLLVAVVGGAKALGRRRREREEEVGRLGTERTLMYDVPAGQDPAAVLAALEADGFDAVSHGTEVVIACPGGAERERARVRVAIANAPLNFEGDPAPSTDVRFSDERSGR